MAHKKLSFEDIKVGDEVPDLVKPITSVGMVMYASATWDFHRFHHDKQYMNDRGFDSPFVDGQELGAFLAQQVVDWAGIGPRLKRLAFRYTKFVVAGDTLTCKGRVSKKSEEDGQGLVECELWIDNQKGERVLDRAKAVLAFPLKAVAST